MNTYKCCDNTINWGVEDYRDKGEPVCPTCDGDMPIVEQKRPTYLLQQDEYDTIYNALSFVIQELDGNILDAQNYDFVEKCQKLLAKWE
jgi:hypothetical protein